MVLAVAWRRCGGRYALPDLVKDAGLPLLCPQSARRG